MTNLPEWEEAAETVHDHLTDLGLADSAKI